MIFYVVMLAYAVAMALIGGAVLARYMLPAVPLVIIRVGLHALAQAAFLAGGGCVRCAGLRCGLVLESSVWILAWRTISPTGLRRAA